MRLTHLLTVVVVGLVFSTLAYQQLTQGASMGWNDGQQRMTNQHAVVRTVGSVAAVPAPQVVVLDASPPPPEPAKATAASPSAAAEAAPTTPEWMQPEHNFLAFNKHAQAALSGVTPKGTTLHFTFGSGVMMDFVKNCARARALSATANAHAAHHLLPRAHAAHYLLARR